MAIVLDTTFLVDTARGDPDAVEKLMELIDGDERMIAPSIVLAEFLDQTTAVREALGRVRDAVRFSSFTTEDAVVAAELARELRLEGRYPGRIDCLIAGFAIARGNLPILTRNARHFPANDVVEY